MAKTFKEIRIYGASSFPRQETSIPGHDCQFNGEKENREVSLHVTGDLVHLKFKDIKTIGLGVEAFQDPMPSCVYSSMQQNKR
jgi:hypothetical protein